MKVFISIAIFSMVARADFFFIKDSKIYSIDSKYSPQEISIDKARFLKIGVSNNAKNGTQSFKKKSISTAGQVVLEKNPGFSKVPPAEGCAENPMKWIKSSKLVGHLKNKDSAIYVQVAPEITSLGSAVSKCPTSKGYANPEPQFSAGKKDFGVLICEDELNYSLLVMKNQDISAELVISENCP